MLTNVSSLRPLHRARKPSAAQLKSWLRVLFLKLQRSQESANHWNKKNKKIFVQQCGVVARDRTPITVREWNKPKEAEWSDVYIDDRFKDELFNDLMGHFKLPECDTEDETAEMRKKVKQFALKKMAELFKNWKKSLWQQYQKDKKTPLFEGYLAKQQPYWDAFVIYRGSGVAEEKSEKTR